MYTKQLSKKMLIAIIVALLCTTGYFRTVSFAEAKGTTLSVVEQGNVWVEELSLKPQFSTWVNAKTSISPLGPGTHSWLMLVEHEQLGTVGYLIIHSDGNNGYVLGEYGVGDENSLHTLNEQRLSLHYINPLHFTIVNTYKKQQTFTDPFSIEQYPINAKLVSNMQKLIKTEKRHGISYSHALITGSNSIAYFSPYDVMPWLTTASLNEELEDCVSIENLIDYGNELRYTSSIWNNKVESVFSITGYHEWELFDLYMAVQQEDEHLVRYIPYNYLLEHGNFYDASTH